MFVILENKFDYENIAFKSDKEEAIEAYNKEKEDYNPELTQSITLFEVTGDGSIYFGDDISVEENVNIIHHINEFEDY